MKEAVEKHIKNSEVKREVCEEDDHSKQAKKRMPIL